MMRIFGAGLIIIACAVLGLARARELRDRARLVRAFASSVEILRGEIVSRLSPLPEAAERLAKSGPAETRQFYVNLSRSLDLLGDTEFSQLWDKCLSLCPLTEESHAALSDLGRSLGRFSAPEQDAALSRCVEALDEASRGASEEAERGGRLFAGLSVCAGALLAVVLY